MIKKLLGLSLVAAALAAPAPAQVFKDMTVLYLGHDGGNTNDFHYYGQTPGGKNHYSFGTTSCNEGNVSLQWTAQRVNIAQNLFRIEDGRLEQLGYSWLKLGFCAVNEPGCGSCQNTPCSTLGVGCADTYWATLNDGHGGHAKFDVNPTTGQHVQGMTSPSGGAHSGRLKVDSLELGHAGATYLAESQYVCEEDAKFGEARNNNSWRPVTTSASGPMNQAGGTVRHECAVEAWRTMDPTVTVIDIDNLLEPTAIDDAEGHYVLGYKTTDLGGGLWRYEYVVQNLTSDQSGTSFSIPANCDGIVITDLFFRDVDHHSGSIYDNTDWTSSMAGGALTWSCTETFAQNQNANALRWGTLFNFGFTANSAPSMTTATLGLFKPGPNSQLTATVDGPCGTPICGTSTYCTSAANTWSLNGGEIGSTGSTGIAANDMSLTVSGVPPTQFGLFFYGGDQTQVAFGNGFLCVTGSETFRLQPPTMSDIFGLNTKALDYTQAPMNAGSGMILAGATWNFQYWYRDPGAGGAFFNLSNGLEATFCP